LGHSNSAPLPENGLKADLAQDASTVRDRLARDAGSTTAGRQLIHANRPVPLPSLP